jgi:hypothetical protein
VRLNAGPAPRAVAKITVPLLGESVIALDSITTQLGLSKTDAVNRALQAYAFLAAIQETGGEVHVKETSGGPLHRLLIHPSE